MGVKSARGGVSHSLAAGMVEHMERLIGGDRVTEAQVLQFIEAKYGAKSLFYLPPRVAREVLRRPADFVRAAKLYCQPELGF